MFPKNRKELENYIREGMEQEMNLVVLIKALKAIEGLTYEDICMELQDKINKIYEISHNALSDCKGCGCNQTKIFETEKAMVYFGTTNKPIHRKVILPDGSRIKCYA